VLNGGKEGEQKEGGERRKLKDEGRGGGRDTEHGWEGGVMRGGSEEGNGRVGGKGIEGCYYGGTGEGKKGVV